MTKQQIKQICDKHIEALSKSAESKFASEITKIGAYQQQVAIMRLCDEHSSVECWASESHAIPYRNPFTGKMAKYIPDFLLSYADKNGKKHILLGCGGSGPTKRIGPEKFTKFMDLVTRDTNCKFFIAAGSNEEEQKIVDAITNSKHKQNCIAINKMDIADTETLAIIKNCDLVFFLIH